MQHLDSHQLVVFQNFNVIAGPKIYSTFLKNNLYPTTASPSFFKNYNNLIRKVITLGSEDLNALLEDRFTYVITRDPLERLKSQLSHVLLIRVEDQAINSIKNVDFPEISYIEEFFRGKTQHYWRFLNKEGLEYTKSVFNSLEDTDILERWAKYAIEQYFEILIGDLHLSTYYRGLLKILALIDNTKKFALLHNPSSKVFEKIGMPNPSGKGFRFNKSHTLWKEYIYQGVMESNKKEFFDTYLKDEYEAFNTLNKLYGPAQNNLL